MRRRRFLRAASQRPRSAGARPSDLLRGLASAAALALAASAPALAQEASPASSSGAAAVAPVAEFVPEAARPHAFELSLQNIMRGFEVVGQSPTQVRWTDDSRWIYFRWLPAGHDWDAERELWRVPAEGGEPELIEDPLEADSLSITFADGDLSPDRRWRASVHRGDLYLVDRTDLSVRRLTDTRASVSNPQFSADGSRLYFVQGSQVHELHLESGAVRQLTDIRSGRASRDEEPEGHRAFLHEQQEELFEFIRRRQAREEREKEIQERREALGIRTVHTGDRGNPSGLQIDRHGQWVAFTASQPARDAERAIVPRWITDDGYTAADSTRTKVGDGVGTGSLGIHRIGSDSVLWLDLNERVKTHAEAHAPVGPHLPEQRDQVREGDLEIRQAMFRGWNDAGTHGLVTAGSEDNKHRWQIAVEAATGELTVLHHLADSAWVSGPCGFCAGWIPDSDRVWFVSEADRFAHLYTIGADGREPRQLTSGEWEVHQVEIPEQRTHFYLRTNEVSPFQQHFYRMDFDGGNREQLTAGTGRFLVDVSPDGGRFAIVHSTQTRPDELFVAENRPGATPTPVTTSPSPEFLDFPWIQADIVHFEAQDGTMVPARIYRPADMGVEPNGGAVLFVHGAGYLQNVHEWWSSYFREWMFHHFLAAQGFTVLDIDYRASAGYGRDWRTAIYRWMGGKDLSDHVDGVTWLVANEGVDPGRIGIYGGSYGGFITLMAMFTEPDVFQAGGALRSVTDWAHYNQGYTSNILNLPQDDPEAYRRSSPIYFAENFRGHLLMGHPMYDTNVHFSDIVRLTQRLIELGKENWELSVYPTENHGMLEPTSWTDQYRRIYELFWKTLSAPGCTAGTGVCEVPVFANP